MLQRLIDIFKTSENPIDEHDKLKTNDENKINETTDDIPDDDIPDDQILFDDPSNCSHDWILYDIDGLNKAVIAEQERMEEQIYRLIEKKINGSSNPLIDKMIELLISARKIPCAKGKCMGCKSSYNVVYLSPGNNIFIYDQHEN
jgi:hypothetical protein